ncbi:Acyl-coa-binding domain-containing protein 2, partial [Globisporangium splendens]
METWTHSELQPRKLSHSSYKRQQVLGMQQQQLFRETVPAVDLTETRTVREWDWVCGVLVHNEKGECAVSILDTVFIEKQQIWSWFSSASGGVVRKKPHTKLHVESVQDAFVKIANAYAHNSARYVAVCLFGDQVRTMQVFGSHELLTYLNSLASSDGAACVSAFVPPRGDLDPIKYANLEHVFTLNKSGRPQFKLFRLALGSQKILSMDAKMNAPVNEVAQRYISFVERNKKVRVVHCVSLFVLDDYGRLFLWRTESCETIPGTSAPLHAPSNSSVHTSSSPSMAFSQNDPHRSCEGPHAVNERILARAKAKAMRKSDEKLIDAILSSPTPQQRRPQLLSTSSSVPNLGGADSALHSLDPFRDDKPQDRLRNTKDWDDALQFLPSTSSLSRGDARLEGKKSVVDQPLLKGDDPMQHRSSVFTATAAAIAFMESRGDEDPLKFQPRRLQHDETTQSQFTIPFKLIAQTRAEKQLVDLFIRRYRNGEDGDYLAEEYYGDGEPLGQTFPGYYYQDVQVCEHCFAFYTLVGKVRMKALDQIAAKRSAKNKILGARQSTGHGKSRVGSRWREESIKEQDERDEILDPERHHCAAEQQTRRIWAQVWAYADSIPSNITKSDTAELYSFVNPHPAIEMVLSSLGILILGKEGAWTELKRAISQEKLLGLLQRFELDHLSLDVVMKAASHARNPLFSPVHIAPVSSCAARFCDWVLSVLQAYAWKNRAMFKDQNTNRVLRFLKPELSLESISSDELAGDGSDSQRLSVNLEASLMDKKANASLSTTGRHRHQKDAARRAIQAQQMARLAAPLGLADAVAQGSSEAAFTCQDGVTKIPYAIVGQAVGETTKCNLVVFHDLFDTLDSTKVFFRSVLARNVGARALFFNFPGQAGTSYPDDTSTKGVLNNTWQARRVHELLNYLQRTKAFITSGMPFHIVGFGNGANIAACYTILHGKTYEGYLQALVLCNGFAKVDAQMAAILHSTVNVFSCFPPSRPDLSVTFFCKFLFSDGYLAKIDPNLALSIYTAVTNAITLDGRIRMCQGALHHIDLVNRLQEIEVPLVLVQSVENAFVAPANVDLFLQGRTNILHAWSHQQPQNGDVRGKTSKQLRHVLATPKSAFVSWLRAGHELRQECKAYITDLLELLVNAKNVEQADMHDTTPSQIAASIPKPRQSDPADGATFERAPRQVLEDTLRSPPSSTANAQSGSQPSSALRPLREPLDAPLVTVPTHTPVAANVKRAPRPTVTKSAYELQLERSEHEFQEAIKTHEAHKAELKKKQAQEKQTAKKDLLRRPAPQQSLPLNAFAARGASQAASPEPPTEVVIQKKPPVAATASFIFDLLPPSLPEPTSHALSTRIDSSAYRQQDKDCSDRAASHLGADMDAVQAKMLENEQRVEREAEELRAKRRAAAEERMEALRQEQERRRREWEEEDAVRLAALEKKLQEEQAERLAATKKREMDLLKLDMESSMATITDMSSRAPSSILRPTQQTTYKSPVNALLSPTRGEKNEQIRLRVRKLRNELQQQRITWFPGVEIVRVVRGFLGRRRFKRYRVQREEEAQQNFAAVCIQRLFRGHTCRVAFIHKLRAKKAMLLQRVYRGHMGRMQCLELREAQTQRRYMDRNAAKIQATWKMYIARDRFLTSRFSVLAAIEIQRMYRGHIGRLEASRKKQWRDAEPGPERLALGLKMIEGSKQAFERQQNEIDALHRAQEAVERQVSTIHSELQESEQELAVLERELQEIDQLEVDLRELTHEDEMLHNGGIEGRLRAASSDPSSSSSKQPMPLGNGIPPASNSAVPYENDVESLFETRDAMKKRQADAYAVEMAIQIKRAEREKKKKDLEAEFTSVFSEVQLKRQALAEMEDKLADMEATRKDREFARLQRNLMELLEEQTLELENLCEMAKRANVNHRNAQGNTPLHFAMAYDADGTLGEYLIARGADDTIENVFGLTPYDGLTAE